MEEDILEKRYEEAMKVINETSLPLFVEDTFEDIFLAYKQDEKIIKEMAIELNNRDFGFDYGIADEDLYDGIIDYFRKKCE